MGKLYRDPDRPFLDIFVHDAEPSLERPPTPDEGEILQVDLDYREPLSRGSWIRCRSCSTSVERARPHAFAFVYLEGEPHGSFKRAHFCDAECWAAWASR